MCSRIRLLLVVGALAVSAAPAQAQFGSKLKEKLKQKVEQKVNGAEKPAEAQNSEAEAPEAPAAKAKESAAPGQGAWANYDFVPGERVLFAEDFSADRVGNFPKRLQFIGGNMEIVESNGKRWLRLADYEEGAFSISLPEALPQRFTLEFDATVPSNWCSSVLFSEADFKVNEAGGASCSAPGGWIGIAGSEVGLGRDAEFVSRRIISDLVPHQGDRVHGMPFHLRLQVDGDYAKLYVGETRVANVPSLKIPRTNKLFFRLQGGTAEEPLMVSGISVNAGGRSLYDALAADGRVATQGIFFDTGSDRIRPESTPTLKEIVAMLKEHPELKLTIEGHTDNVGQSAANQALSEKRAAAVRAYLASQGVDDARLASKGLGDSKPVAPNTTPEGRQQNRRVELVKT